MIFTQLNSTVFAQKRQRILNIKSSKQYPTVNGKVQFYGISSISGKKLLGEISDSGVVRTIKEFDNTSEVKEIIRIGKL